MAKNKKTIDERLSSFNIPSARYKSETYSLMALGYTQEEADRVIIRRSSANTVKTLQDRHKDLVGTFRLSCGEIVSIAAHDGGSSNIIAFITLHADRKFFNLANRNNASLLAWCVHKLYFRTTFKPILIS